MKSTFYSPISILGAAALIVASNGIVAQAETIQPTPETAALEASLQSDTPEFKFKVENSERGDELIFNEAASESKTVVAESSGAELPVPGTVITSAAALQVTETSSAPSEAIESEAEEPVLAQAIDPGRSTVSGPSYIAVGGNIGFGGRTALGRESFVITSKIGLTSRFSARPGLIVNGSPTILLPVTVDFPVRSVVDGRINIAPFVGGGIAISTRGGSEVRALALGGVDIPISERFTATASANAAFFNRPEIGVILGIGYNF